MKQEFSKIEVGSRLLINLSNGSKSKEMSATILRHLKDNIALIRLENNSEQILKFDNLTINIVYTNPNGVPFLWPNSTIVFYQGQYLLQVRADGGNLHNRRNSFRVGISHQARLRVHGDSEYDILVRDISLTGFSVIDQIKIMQMKTGSRATLRFEDIGHHLELEGNLVRVVDETEGTIYGFVITRSCKDLSSYMNIKQKRKDH